MMRLLVGLMAATFILNSCSKADSEEDSNKAEENVADSDGDDEDDGSKAFASQQLANIVESMAPINLSYKNNSSELNLARNLTFDCSEERNSNLGIFGGLWFYACMLSEASEKVLFGQVDPYLELPKSDQAEEPGHTEQGHQDGVKEAQKGDGANLMATDACSKVVEGDKTSFFSILCQLNGNSVIEEVLDVGSPNPSSDDPFFVGISFKEIDGLPSSGTFSQRDLRFPLGARVWDGDSEDSLAASYAVSLKSETEGEIHIFYDFQDHATQAQSRISYKNAPDGADCSQSLKREDCHSQKFDMYGGDETTIQKGMSFTVLANDKEDPDLVVVEGTWTLTEPQARRLMALTPNSDEDTLFEAGRKLYFRMIKKDRLLWAQYIIRGTDGTVIPGAGSGAGQATILAEPSGRCMSFDEAVADPQTVGGLFDYYSCGDTDFAELASKLTLGEDSVEFIEGALPISSLDFTR